MKKIILTSIGLFTGITIFFSCNNTDEKTATEKQDLGKSEKTPLEKNQKTKIAKEALGGIYFRVVNFDEGLIDDSIARMMSLNYKADNHKSYVKNSLFQSMQDSRSIRFSLEKLKEFIAKIEAATNNNTCNLALGITFYYAKYPSANSMDRVESFAGLNRQDVANKHTIFMVPSYLNGKGQWVDFNYNHIGNPCEPISYKRLMDSSIVTKPSIVLFEKYTAFIRNNTYKIDESLLNHGGMAPPPDDGGTFPSPEEDH